MSSALGGALGMSSTYTWAQVVSAITGVANRGAFSKTYTPTASRQTQNGSAGYYSSITTVCNAVSLSGNAGTGQVLSGYTFYNTSLTRQTGTMANRGKLNWSGSNTTYSVPAGYYSGGTLDSRTSYNNGVNAGKNTYGLKSVSGSVTWANPGTKTLSVSFTPVFFISYGTTSSNLVGIFAAMKNFHQIMNWGTTVIRDNSGSQTNQIVFNSNSVSVTTENSAFRGRTMTYHIYGS